MLFTTLTYAVFFGIAFVVSWGLCLFRSAEDRPGELGWAGWARILFLLGMSYGFYAGWNWRYLPLIFGSSTVDYFLARAIDRSESAAARRRLLLVTVVLNLGFLGFFKYWNFALDNVHAAMDLIRGTSSVDAGTAFKVLLPPVGISFFTFESMSYVVDVYRRELPPHKSYFRYLLFVSFFPHLVAGPIVRPRDLLPQFERRPSLSRAEGSEALFLIAFGLLKKLVISDQLSQNLVDRVFEHPSNFSSLEVLAGVYGYAVQIYCDFSGYTDIAIGSALLLGVRFPANFDSPYKAQNLADFWRRWHISLSSWLRDYLYIPLGGNRGSELSTYRNLMLTMLLGGLWHGANWTFVFWGLLHGLGLVVTRIYQRASHRRATAQALARGPYRDAAGDKPEAIESRGSLLGQALGVLLTFHYVCLAWIFFRAPTFKQAWLILKQIGQGTTFHPNLPPLVLTVLGVGLVAHYTPEKLYRDARTGFGNLPAPVQGALLFGVALVLHEAASTAAVPFVYFQF